MCGARNIARLCAAFALFVGIVAGAGPAAAHVKWFAPYIVGAPPQPVSSMLGNVCLWYEIAIFLVFFLATGGVEKSANGEVILSGLDPLPAPLSPRLDDFVRVVVGAFFIAI